MTVHRSFAARHIRWVAIGGMVGAGGSYIVLSVLGFSSLAGSVAQWIFWFLSLYILVGILYVAVSRKRRVAAQARIVSR